MKICKTCCKELDLCFFYAHPKANDGLDSSCKECRKEKVRTNRAAKVEYYREYDQKRFKNDPRVKERISRYQSTDAGKETLKRSRQKYKELNPVKRAAHVILGNYVRDGKIAKLYQCEECGSTKGPIHGHHDDYAFPLSVRWLCPACHKKWHDENGEGKNA